ncbi:hypothetical protein PHYBLDRAFT_153581 [Phycomyces blakesleeanus NRRL 1555(-)]|uniref:Uncharacterized protein n=1 Tax=Phycomyces blakesleeanus (strain ATCC 8743b / DSM 1359 / FGSC 10004 / NBRC 33097 / NRRL 1555) TaxID=763407 RepID=A0A162T9T8_PHYB8|nr:hypothetical protein PHYBLDRAFT_153581 [Phycomyces blakesleeanus NRRL 1555(-)]OAD65333.1 hypothetical protein PHYBLDRAFT_153581 [Phycomyces blakesleeanus NRRL 1555(-)]|eukprot:XP_018283373.1 hypothetical protein PHYBLDRAFT_153581 [Phycomyces blakesleeanus NRRL 1555(-)]
MTYTFISFSNSEVIVYCNASAQPLTSDNTAVFTALFGKNRTTRVGTMYRRKSSQSTARVPSILEKMLSKLPWNNTDIYGLELVIQLPIVTSLVLGMKNGYSVVEKVSSGRV